MFGFSLPELLNGIFKIVLPLLFLVTITYYDLFARSATTDHCYFNLCKKAILVLKDVKCYSTLNEILR